MYFFVWRKAKQILGLYFYLMINKKIYLLLLLILSLLAIPPVLGATIDDVDTDPETVEPGGQVNISVYSDGVAFILKDIPRNWTIVDNSSNFIDYKKEENTTTWIQGTGWIIFEIPQNTKTNTTHTLNTSVRGDYKLTNITIQKPDIDNQTDSQDQQNGVDDQQNNTQDQDQDQDQKPQNITDNGNQTDTQGQDQQQDGTGDMDQNLQNDTEQNQNDESQQQPGFGFLATIFTIILSFVFVYKKKQ